MHGVPVASNCRRTIALVIGRMRRLKKGLVADNVKGTKRVTVGVTAAFYSANAPTCFLRPDRTRRNSLNVIHGGSIVLLVSGSNGAHRLLRLIRLAHNLMPRVRFVIVANGPSDPLTTRTAVYLPANTPGRIYPLNLAPAASAAIVAIVNSLLMINAVGHVGFNCPSCTGQRRNNCLNSGDHRRYGAMGGWET